MTTHTALGGLQLVPSALVPLVRPLLASQGIPASALSNEGVLDELALLSSGFDTVEIRSTLAAPVVINLKGPPDPKGEALLREIQPAILFSGRAGKFQIAPYGIPLGISPEVKRWGVSIGIGVGAALLGVLFFGSVLGQRRCKAPKPIAGFGGIGSKLGMTVVLAGVAGIAASMFLPKKAIAMLPGEQIPGAGATTASPAFPTGAGTSAVPSPGAGVWKGPWATQ